MTLTLFDCCLAIELLSPRLLLSIDDCEENGIAVSQKEAVESVIELVDSASGSKIIDSLVGASIDINSTQWSLRTWKAEFENYYLSSLKKTPRISKQFLQKNIRLNTQQNYIKYQLYVLSLSSSNN